MTEARQMLLQWIFHPTTPTFFVVFLPMLRKRMCWRSSASNSLLPRTNPQLKKHRVLRACLTEARLLTLFQILWIAQDLWRRVEFPFDLHHTEVVLHAWIFSQRTIRTKVPPVALELVRRSRRKESTESQHERKKIPPPNKILSRINLTVSSKTMKNRSLPFRRRWKPRKWRRMSPPWHSPTFPQLSATLPVKVTMLLPQV